MTQAEKLAAVYAAKLSIREAIKGKGVSITNETPFSQYAAKILLIEGGGSGINPTDNTVTQGFGVTDMATLVFIPMAEYGTTEIFAIYGKTSELAVDDAIILYPPTTENNKTEIADISRLLGITIDETAELTFSLWAFAESFRLRIANKYDYNADWVEFTDNGVYIRDRVFTISGGVESITENGVVFSTQLPNRQSYGNIITITAKITEVADGGL